MKNKLNIGDNVVIDGIEHNHLKNVIRLGVGDEIILVCGDEFDYLAKIISISKGDTIVQILDKTINICNPKHEVAVFQALVKSDNMSLIIQKLTELGVSDFFPFESEFVTAKDKMGKSNKFQEISNQSIKQCKRSLPMIVHDICKFDDMYKYLNDYDLIIFANECEKTKNLKEINIDKSQKIAIIIGSEGGFGQSEINKLENLGAKSVTLGSRILRAETCAIALTAVVMYKIGEWSND